MKDKSKDRDADANACRLDSCLVLINHYEGFRHLEGTLKTLADTLKAP